VTVTVTVGVIMDTSNAPTSGVALRVSPRWSTVMPVPAAAFSNAAGLQREGSPATDRRLFVPPERALGFGQICVIRGGIGPKFYRPTDELGSTNRVAALQVQQAEQMQCLGIIGLHVEQRLINPRRAGVKTGLLQRVGAWQIGRS
jgi:hypothetical protein